MMSRLQPLQQALATYREKLQSLLGMNGPAPSVITEPDEGLWSLSELQALFRDFGAMSTVERSEALTLSPLAAGDARFVERDKEITGLQSVLQAWRSGRSVMAVVTGPQGSGISSLVNQLPLYLEAGEYLRKETLSRRLQNDADVHAMIAAMFDLSETPASSRELIALLHQQPARILFVDNAHFLASRVLGARDAVRCLGAIMVATQDRHLWILGCHQQAWQRMCYTHQAERFFSHTIMLEYFSIGQLPVFINRRREAAQDVPLDDVQPIVQRLYSLTRGKPDLVLLYLMEFPLPDTHSFRPLDMAVLKRLEQEDLFTLAELMVHGSLSLFEHQRIFRLSAESSQLRLNQLYNWGLLERIQKEDGTVECYHVLPMLTVALTDHLYKTNYLY